MHLLSTNLYGSSNLHICVWNVLIPKTINLKIQQSKLIEKYSQILNPGYIYMLCTHFNCKIMSLFARSATCIRECLESLLKSDEVLTLKF